MFEIYETTKLNKNTNLFTECFLMEENSDTFNKEHNKVCFLKFT
jgi:hypothetical protein